MHQTHIVSALLVKNVHQAIRKHCDGDLGLGNNVDARYLLLNDDKLEDGIEIATISIFVCADCFKGTLRGDVIPTGHEDVIHGLPTYIATPKWKPWVKPLGTVVLITNASGQSVCNTRALANSYARRVLCIVYVPDFMDGKAISLWLMASFESKPDPNSPWIFRILWPRVRSFLAAVRKTPTANGEPPKVGVAGFFWGGPYAVGLTNTQNPVNWLPRHIHEVQLPLSLANGENDSSMGQEKMKEVMSILRDKNKAQVKEAEGADRPVIPNAHEALVYPGAKHGFAVRGDREHPLQKERGDQSEDQAVRWFPFNTVCHGSFPGLLSKVAQEDRVLEMNLWSARRLFGEWCLFLPLYVRHCHVFVPGISGDRFHGTGRLCAVSAPRVL
ncbi:hypothetical protein GE21DRAFT_1852 [Neurospora crassa]|uniref:Dienelactone hydrolase domain-containing protein n=1 Tax=Neurospora crassa (strain ATCC 24698 / 74-OR23-1A / CBS 708.71 / DSM 1257 / FGSC 987) TaxID=367110 RepID=Q7SFH7_NEUCR|nr:hypothetical protein NCU00854 [Neurospora crassa OR74A]EAA35534.2 hypothetical protein NCU00854 [Neurospora crassa OR74A]KHE82171.1 hypothetical protein GE21DRAFT_1852 [Neurospora crassa]|eukprot:XP_964770.2 hypothetical protein NCU00854 [Neurospora crassa OR74A]